MYIIFVQINYPQRILLLRGNHECRAITEHFTFREEVLEKFDKEVYNLIMDSFDTMPLIAIVNGQYFCVHGGISPLIKTLDDINHVNRFQEIPADGLICDLLWSDPMDD